jgi:protein-S-isoprenylcysteine O-methyltransferase Ste14
MSDARTIAPNTVPWPPVIYGVAILAAVLLGLLVPLPWIGQPLSDILFAVGLLAIGAALALIIMAIRTLRRHNTTEMPHRPAEHLVTDGPFGLTRNPIYLGDTLLFIGIGLASGVWWFIILGIVAAFATQKLAIEREERHLDARFGKRYRDYRKKVRRWI